MRPFYQHAIGETVSVVVFLNGSPASLLIGAGNRSIRFIDMRAPQSNTGTQQVLSRHFSGLCTDPFDDIQFASFGDDAIIRVWDRRSLTKGPALTFSELNAGNPTGKLVPLAGISYCPNRKGLFATLRSEDTRLRLWDILTGRWENDFGLPMTGTPPASRLPTWNSPDVIQNSNLPSQLTLTGSRICKQNINLMLSVLLICYSSLASSVEGLQSFCFATTAVPPSGNAPHFLAVSKDGSLRIRPVLHPPHHCWSPSGDFTASDINDLSMYRFKRLADDSTVEPWIVETSGAQAVHLRGTSSASDDGRIGRLPRTTEPESIEHAPHGSSSLTASRPSKATRTFSPSAMRRYSVQGRTRSRTPQRSSEISPSVKRPPLSIQAGPPIAHSENQTADGLSSQDQVPREATAILSVSAEEDIASLMLQRTLSGYGLQNVS